jgi:hypothetical protein
MIDVPADIARQIAIDNDHDPIWTEFFIRAIREGVLEIAGRYESGKLLFRKTGER